VCSYSLVQVVLSSIIVHGVSIPAHKGLVRVWDGVEKRYFPKQWEAYQVYREDRDKELKAAEEGEQNQDHNPNQNPESGNGEQNGEKDRDGRDGQQSGEQTPRNSQERVAGDNLKAPNTRETLSRRPSAGTRDE
jgi:hypothetical protein